MTVFRYDRSWEGLLTAVFDAYFRKIFPEALIGEGEPEPMFTDRLHTVVSQPDKSDRVWKALEKKLPKEVRNMLMHVWLSEGKGCDELLFRYMRKVFDAPHPVYGDFADPDVLEVRQLAQKVSCEGSRLKQFIRFRKGGDGTFFAPVFPQHNSLPLAIGYLKDRFADQKWLVYDTKRRYGYYYDLERAVEVTLEDDAHLLSGNPGDEYMAEDEKLFHRMWKEYFKAMAIKERINPRLHRQNMPRRFWKYLIEKQ